MRVLLLIFLVLLCVCSAAWAGDGVVALQSADPSCRTTTTPPPIYVDCGNGTVTDNRTGLVWLKNANCLGDSVDWFKAMEFAAGLSDIDVGSCGGVSPALCDCGLTDSSSPGEWRLPSPTEWTAMVEDAVALGCTVGGAFGGPSITNDLGTECWHSSPGNSFSGVVDTGSSIYWSPNTFIESLSLDGGAWLVSLWFGAISNDGKQNPHFVWPVRGGQ